MAAPPGPYPEQSQATTALVLGILAIVVCGLLGPVAWSIGATELRAIDEGRRAPDGRGSAQAGKILGIVGTVLLAVAIGLFLLFIILVSVSSTTTL